MPSRSSRSSGVVSSNGAAREKSVFRIRRAASRSGKPLITVAREATEMKDEYINAAGNDVTQAWIDYVAPLVGELPKMGRL